VVVVMVVILVVLEQLEQLTQVVEEVLEDLLMVTQGVRELLLLDINSNNKYAFTINKNQIIIGDNYGTFCKTRS
jgi:hypothetical protein